MGYNPTCAFCGFDDTVHGDAVSMITNEILLEGEGNCGGPSSFRLKMQRDLFCAGDDGNESWGEDPIALE